MNGFAQPKNNKNTGNKRHNSTGADPGETDASLETVYDTLRRIAHRERSRNPSNTINTTVLVHEAWLKLEPRSKAWNDTRHCKSTYAIAIRQILVDYARARSSAKRTPTDDYVIFETEQNAARTAEDVLAIDAALSQLEALDERLARLVELRFFIGLTLDEAARDMDISPRTAAREWKKARAFLQTILK